MVQKTKNKALQKPRSREVPDKTRIFLFVRAGGRCQFDGCNRYLIEHHLTKDDGIFAQMAHIWAFGDAGPRANSALKGREVHALSNLMLLCPGCHKLVDDHEERYTVEVLRAFKKAHEDRVFSLTDTKPDRHTVAVSLKAQVGGQAVAVSLEEMQEAVAPRYVGARDVLQIDLTAFQDRPSEAFWDVAAAEVRSRAQRVYTEQFEGGLARHVSVFALAPMPLLIALGRSLSNKVPTTLYQRHRDTENWKWKPGGEPVKFATRVVRSGTDESCVALLLSLSGRIPHENLPDDVDERFSVYEMTLQGVEPSVGFLKHEASLHEFRGQFMKVVAQLLVDHGGLERIHLFPAVPAPVAVAIGRDLLPKRDPILTVYDFDKRARGDAFVRTLDVNGNEENE